LWPSAQANHDFPTPVGPQIVVGVDPGAVAELLEQGAVGAAGGPVIDVFDGGLVAQPGIAQATGELAIVAVGGLAFEQQAQSFREGELGGLVGAGDLAEGLGHAEQSQLIRRSRVGWASMGISSMVVA
jgi:hypothetical protein